MFILALAFIFAGRIESIVFDKKQKVLIQCKTTVFCYKNVERFPIEDISEVITYKRGHHGASVYTIHYIIEIVFNNYPPFKLIETGSESKAIKQTCIIKNFLGYDCSESEIRIID